MELVWGVYGTTTNPGGPFGQWGESPSGAPCRERRGGEPEAPALQAAPGASRVASALLGRTRGEGGGGRGRGGGGEGGGLATTHLGSKSWQLTWVAFGGVGGEEGPTTKTSLRH